MYCCCLYCLVTMCLKIEWNRIKIFRAINHMYYMFTYRYYVTDLSDMLCLKILHRCKVLNLKISIKLELFEKYTFRDATRGWERRRRREWVSIPSSHLQLHCKETQAQEHQSCLSCASAHTPTWRHSPTWLTTWSRENARRCEIFVVLTWKVLRLQ